MNFLILGDGPEEVAWAVALAGDPEHRVIAACPSLKAFPDLPGGPDLDEALAVAGVEAVIVGGEPDFRAEALRRAAGAGLPTIVLHPPGPNADPYYQIALSGQETGAIVVPDLPGRIHPGVETIRVALDKGLVGEFRGLRYEVAVGPGDTDLAGVVFPRLADLARAVVGEIEAVTATGVPPGERPASSLVVHLRGPSPRTAEVRIAAGIPEPARLVLSGSEGSLAFEHDPSFAGPSRLIRRNPESGETITEVDAWDPRAAILDTLAAAVAGRPHSPGLTDGTRAMELAEAAVRSLRRGRTIELFYEEMSEAGNFKSVMTGVGCGLLLAAIALLPLALAGPVFGFRGTIYLAWAIPPLLVLFVFLQLLRFAVRTEPAAEKGGRPSRREPGAD